MGPTRFDDLLDRYLAGSATAAEESELEALLRADAGRRRRLAERLLLEVHLRKAFAGIATTAPLRRRWLSPPRRLLVLATAAVVLLAVGLGLFGLFGRGKPPVGPSIEEKGAPVLAGEVTVDGAPVNRVPDDRWFETAGDAPAVVRLPDDSRAEFAPDSKAMVHTGSDPARRDVEIERGSGRFRVTHGGPFRVKTSVGTVAALGTEFSVKLESRGKREGKRREGRGTVALVVAVTEGSVRVEVGEKKYVLKAGESRTFGESRKREEGDD